MYTSKTTKIEEILTAAEKLLNVSITIIDNNGLLHYHDGKAMVDSHRQSHRRNPVCDLVFKHYCILHCRREVITKVKETKGKPFVHTCRNNVCELVIPLYRNNLFYGSLFAGQWRDANKQPPKNISTDALAAWKKLKYLDQTNIQQLILIFETLMPGLIEIIETNWHISALASDIKTVIERFIMINSRLTVTLADLAEELSLSASRTSHLVRQLCGKSFQEKLIERRLNIAKSDLIETNNQINEIALLAGFTSYTHFSRIFKKYVKISPHEYRKKHQPV